MLAGTWGLHVRGSHLSHLMFDFAFATLGAQGSFLASTVGPVLPSALCLQP